MTRLIYITILILVSCGQTKPVEDKGKERIDSVCGKIMQAFRAGNSPDAMQLLKQNSVIGNSAIDTLQNTVDEQMKNLLRNYGKARSYEFVLERKSKNTIAKRFYLLKFDKYYLKFDFTLYNNGDGWTITNFSYNSELIELLY